MELATRLDRPRRLRQLVGGARAHTLVAPEFLCHAHTVDTQRFALCVASGQPHATGMLLWTRLAGSKLPKRVELAKLQPASDLPRTDPSDRQLWSSELLWRSIETGPTADCRPARLFA
jgi:hypothetical protein